MPCSSPAFLSGITMVPSALTMVVIRPDLPKIGVAQSSPFFSSRKTLIYSSRPAEEEMFFESFAFIVFFSL